MPNLLEQLAQDLRFGARTLRRSPGFAAAALVTLALGLGATTAIFSILNSVLLRPLPFAEPGRLVQLYGRAWRTDRGANAPDPMNAPVGARELEEFVRQSRSFEGFAGYAVSTRHLHGPAEPERLTAVVAEPGFFSLLGVAPLVGRTFRSGDPADVVVLGARLWRRRFDGDPTLPGKTITLDGRAFTVLGVMPERFQFPYSAASGMPGALPESRTDLWVPLEPAPTRRGRVNVIARLKPGVPLEAGAAELRVIAERIQRQQEDPNVRVGARLVPLDDVVLGTVRRSLWLLFAAVGLVLVAACATVANLLLARMAMRTREVATRAALGAGRLRLVRQLLAESLLLSLAGGLAGALVARWGTNLLVALGSAKIPRAHEVQLDWRVFGFLLAACLTTAVLFGLAPALAAARVNVQEVLKDAGGHATAGRGYGALRDALVVTEVALAFVLTLGAALVVREVVRLRSVDTGMVTENVITLHLTPRAPAATYYEIERRVAQLDGVRAAGFTQLVPLQNWGWEGDFRVRGRETVERMVTDLRYVTPGYFRALGVPLLRGRALTERDDSSAARVVLVNDALARRYFPGEDPVGRELDRGTIVGVVGDVRQAGLDRPAGPELYYPAAQNVATTSDLGMTLVVRTAARPEAMVARLRSAVREVSPALAIFNVKTMEQVVADSLWELNLYRWLIGLFAALVLVLAVGALAAAATTPALERVSAGLRGDAATYAGIAALVLVIALAACLLPALRVAGVNPAAALRHE